MSRRQLGIALCLCAGALLFANTVAAAHGRPSGQAIQFGIRSDLTLGSFGEPTIAYQRFIGRSVAWRATLGLELQYDDGEHAVKFEGLDPVDDSKDHTSWNNAISVVSEWLWYRGSTVAVFFGCGPRVLYSNWRDEYWDYHLPDREWERRWRALRQAGAGVQGCLGVQWAAVGWLTLHAEYDARVMYVHVVAESEHRYYGESAPLKERTTTDGLSFQSAGVRLGLSAYF